MRDVTTWLEWPHGVVRIGVVFLVAATLVAVGIRYPALIGDLGDEASRSSDLSYSDREIAGGNGLVVDQTAVYAARALIPDDDTFNVVVNPAFEGGTPETVVHVAGYYRYFLMPRRMAESADWVICYACDWSAYGHGAEVVWEGTDGISIVHTAR
ncbi:MAG TPA: hypothetical protein VFU99_04160 [Gaiellaceae bacterium]|nr:hypothetical protein [Gaiellaceae bacterium]